MDGLASHRMREAKSPSVQSIAEVARKRRAVRRREAARAIERIIGERVSDGRHVNADLVRSPCVDEHLDETEPALRCPPPKFAPGPLPRR